jgi:hypothetical protein
MDRKILFFILITIFPQLLVVGISFSAIDIKAFTVSPSTISLPDQDPDLYTEVSSAVNLSVRAQITGMGAGQSWTLEIYSNQDLISGGDSISIGNVRWTVTGTDPSTTFSNGTLSLNQYITTAKGSGNTNQYIYFTFYLKNFWTYATGNYTSVVTLRLTAGTGAGQVQQSRTFTFNLLLIARAKLEFGNLGLDFPDADPDIVTSIPANVNPISVTSSTRTGSSLTATLTSLAGGDLISGTNAIAIGNMTWTASGTGYAAGTMNKTTAQTAGSWIGSGKRTGSFNYFLTNSWSYTTGNYSTTISYTLTAP